MTSVSFFLFRHVLCFVQLCFVQRKSLMVGGKLKPCLIMNFSQKFTDVPVFFF